MQSKTNKLRGQLANVAQEREQFEKQMKDLEAQMYKGKSNMDKINKWVRPLVSDRITQITVLRTTAIFDYVFG